MRMAIGPSHGSGGSCGAQRAWKSRFSLWLGSYVCPPVTAPLSVQLHTAKASQLGDGSSRGDRV